MNLDQTQSGVLYSPHHIVDSMFYEVATNSLWWTDYLTGGSD